MIFTTAGGSHVDRSATRAGGNTVHSDRLAVGVITATDSWGSAAKGQAASSGQCPEAPPMDGARKGPSGTAATACKPSGGALSLITGDKDRGGPVGGPTHSLEGADEAGRFEPGSLTEILVTPQVRVLPGCAFGAAKGGPTGMGRSDGEERPAADRGAGHMPTCALIPRDVSTVGTLSEPRLTSLLPADAQPEVDRPPVISGAYSPWSVRPGSTSLRSTYP